MFRDEKTSTIISYKKSLQFQAMSYAAYFTNGSILVLAPMQETRLQAKAGREILS